MCPDTQSNGRPLELLSSTESKIFLDENIQSALDFSGPVVTRAERERLIMSILSRGGEEILSCKGS